MYIENKEIFYFDIEIAQRKLKDSREVKRCVNV